MLTQEDLQAIGELITTAVTSSEQRMTTKIIESEQRMTMHLNTVVESSIMPKIHQIADGHLMLAEKMDRMEQKIDNLQSDVDLIKGELVAQDYINAQTRNAINLFAANQSPQIDGAHGEPGQVER